MEEGREAGREFGRFLALIQRVLAYLLMLSAFS